MTVKSEVQGVVQALFGAYAGGYLAELTAEATANGSAAVAARLVTIQGIILGRDMSDNQTFVDTILNNLGVPSTNDAYEAAAAWAMGELTAGASRADIVSAAVAFLDGIAAGTIVDSKYTAIAEAFAASVEAGIEYSEGDGAEVFGLADLQAEAAIPALFNLTAALATLAAADDALETFLVGLDLDGDGEADTDVAATANGNLTAALAAEVAVVDGLIGGASFTTANAAGRTALIAAQEATNDAALIGANAALTAAQADVTADTGLQAAIDAYEAADDANTAAEAALLEAQSDTAAAESYLMTQKADGDDTLVRNADGTYSYDADGAGAGAAVTIITTNGDDLVLNTGVTDTTYVGVSALLAASIAQEAAEADATDAAAALVLAYTALDTQDGTLGDGDASGIDVGDTPLYAALVAAQTGVTNAQVSIDALAEALADLAAVEALDDARTALEDDVTAAAAAIDTADAPYALVELDGAGAAADAAGAPVVNDLYVLNFDVAVDATATITNFGVEGQDFIYIGNGYTLNTGAITTAGNNSVLEVFLTELGGNAIITLESVVFGSNSAATGAESEVVITLSGVPLADITLANGFVQLA